MTHARTEYPDITEKGRKGDSRSPLRKEPTREQATKLEEESGPLESDKK